MTRSILPLVMLVVAATVHAAAPTQIDVAGPLLVGFFPPLTQKDIDEDDGGIREGVAHLEFALEDLVKCLGGKGVISHLEYTRALVLRDGPKSHALKFPTDWAHSVGIVLAVPGKKPRVVYAKDGPSSLQWLALDAGADYFSAPACKRNLQ